MDSAVEVHAAGADVVPQFVIRFVVPLPSRLLAKRPPCGVKDWLGDVPTPDVE
jgi:hypothetical protein